MNSTSRGVPYSITVFSDSRSPLSSTPVTRTGMRTGVASGKNFASREMQVSVCSEAKASLDKIDSFGLRPRRDTRRHKSTCSEMHESGQIPDPQLKTIFQWFTAVRGEGNLLLVSRMRQLSHALAPTLRTFSTPML